MTNALAERPTVPPLDPAIVANVLLTGDLEKLNDQQRMAYCQRVCESLGLNAMTQPFAFIKLNGKLRMYALKDATEQLRKIHGVSITEVTSQRIEDVFVVTAKALDRTGRTDAATGAVTVGNLKGDALANALMKAETKAKRRVTLSICGLGMLDETETETIRQEPPRLTIEAATRIDLPEGTVQVLKVTPRRAGQAEFAEVTYVDAAGVEHTHNTTVDWKGSAAALFEQLAQEAVPVTLTTKVTPRSKKTVIDQVHRWAPPVPDEPAIERPDILTAESIPFAWILPIAVPLLGVVLA